MHCEYVITGTLRACYWVSVCHCDVPFDSSFAVRVVVRVRVFRLGVSEPLVAALQIAANAAMFLCVVRSDLLRAIEFSYVLLVSRCCS